MATPTSNGVVSTVNLSGLQPIDSLLGGTKWGDSTGTAVDLTYSFGEADTSYYTTDYSGEAPLNGFAPLTSTQKIAAQNALNAWSEVANLNFTQVIDSQDVAGDIRFAKSSNPSTAYAYLPSTSAEAGDIWFSHSDDYNTAQKGTYGYHTFLHEIGHALGLKHPHENDFGGVADINIDTTAYSVMSYRSYVGQPVDAGYSQNFYPTTPMLNDIAAIQYLYGANINTRSGNTVYQWASGQQLLETIWDAGGSDTINWSNQSTNAKINLNAGQWSELGSAYWNGVAWENQTLAIAYGVTIENAIGGSGNDIIIGNDVANVLSGRTGNDTLHGDAGNDTLHGDAGNDTLHGDAGNDTLRGGTGNDSMEGGAGNDRYFVDSIADVVVEYATQGIDTVYSAISYSLGGNVENLTLTGTDALNGYGNSLNNRINGNGADNTLSGENGNDTLNGGGGNDTLNGGAGADNFVFSSLNEGIDTISDFTSQQDDKILVSASGFGDGLTLGELDISQFIIGSAALGFSERFIYNSSTGGLFFDADGIGVFGQVQFATLSTGLDLISSDIVVI